MPTVETKGGIELLGALAVVALLVVAVVGGIAVAAAWVLSPVVATPWAWMSAQPCGLVVQRWHYRIADFPLRVMGALAVPDE